MQPFVRRFVHPRVRALFFEALADIRCAAGGDINSYAVFAETFYTVAGRNSGCGLIVPSGILTDDTTKLFFQELQSTHALAQAIDFENNETLFPGVGHGRMRFCLLTIRKGLQTKAARLFFLARGVADLADEERWFELGPGDCGGHQPETPRRARSFSADAMLRSRRRSIVGFRCSDESRLRRARGARDFTGSST